MIANIYASDLRNFELGAKWAHLAYNRGRDKQGAQSLLKYIEEARRIK
jgi:hypothetical protein